MCVWSVKSEGSARKCNYPSITAKTNNAPSYKYIYVLNIKKIYMYTVYTFRVIQLFIYIYIYAHECNAL